MIDWEGWGETEGDFSGYVVFAWIEEETISLLAHIHLKGRKKNDTGESSWWRRISL